MYVNIVKEDRKSIVVIVIVKIVFPWAIIIIARAIKANASNVR